MGEEESKGNSINDHSKSHKDLAPPIEGSELAKRISGKFNEIGMHNELKTFPEGLYASLITFHRELDGNKKVRVFRTIYALENNVVGDTLNQVAYALRKSGNGRIEIYKGKAMEMVDDDPQLTSLVDELLTNPSISLLTKLCEIKKGKTNSAESVQRLEDELIEIEDGVERGENLIDLMGYSATRHPFSIPEGGLACGVSISFADKSPFRPAVTGIEIDGNKIVGLTMIIDVNPERLDMADEWQGSIRGKIRPEEISGIMISSTNIAEAQDNSQELINLTPGNIMEKAERAEKLEQILQSRREIALTNRESDLEQIRLNRERRSKSIKGQNH